MTLIVQIDAMLSGFDQTAVSPNSPRTRSIGVKKKLPVFGALTMVVLLEFLAFGWDSRNAALASRLSSCMFLEAWVN